MLPSNLSAEIATLRSQGGYFRASDFGLIEVYGKDTARFLQSQTTNDVMKLAECTGQLSCLLDRKAHVKAFFHLFRRHDSFRIIAERDQIQSILEHLEEYKFNDKVEFLDLSATGGFFAIQGPQVLKLFRQSDVDGAHLSACSEHDVTDLKLWSIPVHAFRKSVTGEMGYFLWISQSQLNEFVSMAEKSCSKIGFTALSPEALQLARIEAGLPRYKQDFSEENLLPEIGLEEAAVSYTKGCFLGQEVLARVKAHGAPTRALVGLRFATKSEKAAPLNTSFISNGEDVATIKSNGFSSFLDANIALAFVKRDHRVEGKTIVGELEGKATEATVVFLPFYKAEGLKERARKLYEKALTLFPTESEDVVESESVRLLRECLDLNPFLEEAYEVLGVILSKRDRLEEAIALMKKLAEINPDSVMAHTNLSVFYMQKGLKEEAEEEKAISLSIRMRLAAKEVSQAQRAEENKQKQQEETLARMEMFKQVLDIDSEDLLANYGLGSCLVDLDKYAEAVPYLTKAIAIKPTHTVAYVALSKAYESLGKNHEAAQTLEKGIEVASKRGDMTPLREMQDRLKALDAGKTRA